MSLKVKTKAPFPEKLAPLFTPAPFKIVFGGRGKGASWGFARAALILGSKRKLFVVCAREVQKSIKDSVHKLLEDQIVALNYHAHKDPETGEDVPALYEVLDTEIRGSNGTAFVFVGLNNINSIKSYEGIDILWVTEAVHVSRAKWNVLIPTVRRDPPFGPFKQGSEIWVDFNPELTSDDTYQMFIVSPPDNSVVIEASYEDNPFFPEILRKRMLQMRRDDYDEYLNIYKGKPKKAVSGAIFAKDIRKAIEDGRIGPHVKRDPKRPSVFVFDLGDEDVTAMWEYQQIGNEHNCVFYVEESHEDISYFCGIIQDRKSFVRGIWLPHDAKQGHQSARRLVHNTIEKQVKAIFNQPGVVKVVPNTSVVLQLNATRQLWPRININDVECSRGMMCLQHYQFGVNPETKQVTSQPLHNWASHGASAFMQYATYLKEGIKKEREQDIGEEAVETERASKFAGVSSNSWMLR